MVRHLAVFAALCALSAAQMGGCSNNDNGFTNEQPVETPAEPPPPPAVPPTVLSTSPSDGAANVPVSASILVIFSQPMDAATIDGTNLMLSRVSPPGAVSAGVSLGGDQVTASLVPASSLAAGAPYSVTVTTGVRDATGLAMAAPYSFGFTTGSSADSIPPAFGGADSATALNGSSISVQWSAASDNVTPSAEIVYLLYAATSSGGQNFSLPTATSGAGATSHAISGLNAGTTYYIVVRARDASGNVDSNVTQVTATTPTSGVSFAANVWPILSANCGGCHRTGRRRPYLESASAAYSSMVNVVSDSGLPWYYVKPGDSALSTMYQTMIPGNPTGVDMPPNGQVSAADAQVVKDWIDAGAPNN